MEGRGWDARKIINHGLGFHKAPFKLCTVHRLLPGSPSRLWRRKYTSSGGLLFPTSASPSLASILRIKMLISARENNLAGLLCENSTSPTTPSSLSNYTAWTLSKLVDWWRFVWTDGKPLNYIRGQDFLDPGFHRDIEVGRRRLSPVEYPNFHEFPLVRRPLASTREIFFFLFLAEIYSLPFASMLRVRLVYNKAYVGFACFYIVPRKARKENGISLFCSCALFPSSIRVRIKIFIRSEFSSYI